MMRPDRYMRAALALLLGLIVQQAAAATAACGAATDLAQRTTCMQAEFRRADGELGVLYTTRMEQLAGSARADLRNAQHAWLRQRDPRCKQEAQASEGRPDWSLNFFTCLHRQTVARSAAIADADARRLP